MHATSHQLRSRHHKTILAGIAAFAISLAALSCTERERVPENEEEAVYMLVGGPVSEGDYTLAIARADSILASPREMSDSLRAYIMIERDNAISEYGHLDWGAAYADTVIAFGKTHDVPLAVIQGLLNRGIVHRRKGDYEKAISDYKSGMAMAVEAKDTDMEQALAEMLAIACSETNLNDEAVKFAHRSLKLSQEAGDITGELNSVSTIGGILAKQGRHQEAISTLLPYHATASQTKSLLRVKYLTALLRAYLSLDSLDMVHKTLAETYEALDGVPRNTQAYLVAVNTEAELAAKEGRYADQWKWLQRADTIGGMGASPEVLLGVRARCLANMGKFADAYEMETKALVALDSLRKEQNDATLAELSVKYDTLSKENEIVKLRAQRLLWGLAALGCLMIVVGLVITTVMLRRRERRRLERARQEEYLRGLEQERQRMARELHDDVAGSLVGLQWQLRTLSPAESEKKVMEIAGRVRRMSHELMPPEFSERTFTDMLLDFVAQYNLSDRGKRIVITDEGSFRWDSLSVTTSHELYRMLQEAVNNASRHGSDGDISIQLSGDSRFEISVSNPLPSATVENDGKGTGLRSMQARAATIGAILTTETDHGMFILKISQKS